MIGYYVHHEGVGHLTRADAVIGELDEHVTVFSSRPRPDGHAASEWVVLPMDTGSGEPADPTAGGALHWAPLGVDGLTGRMAMLAAWIAEASPSLMVVDVSVEVTALVRLLGIPVVVVAMPGDRTDDPHTLAYRAATHIIAPWSHDVYTPAWLRPYDAKTTYTGSISRFDGRRREPDATASALVLGAGGGTSLTEDVVAGWHHRRHPTRAVGFGTSPWVEDVWPLLCGAAVVVTHAGQNAVADVAAAGVPAIIVAQQRPFGEQHATARALADAELAVVCTDWPRGSEWSSIVDAAIALGGSGWTRVQTCGAAGRAARAITETAGDRR